MARTLFSSMAATFSAPMKKLTAGEWLGAFGMSGATATGLDINQRTAMMSTAVMAAVSVLSEDVSKMTPEIFRRVDAGGRLESARVIAKDHFLYNLLWRPNDWQTWPEFCREMMIGYLLRGNAYAVILRNNRGVPYALVPINPDRGRLWESPDGSLFFLVNRLGLHETAVLSEYGLLIPYEDVFHLKDLATNGLVGTSRIALAAEAIALSLGQEKQYASIMGNGARPSGYLTTDVKIDPKVAERLKADWKSLQSGLGNTGGTAILEQGLKWAPLTLTMADLEFLAARNFQVIEVCRIFRVPPHMIGDLTRGTYSNVVQGAQEYRNNTLTSHSDIWEKRLDFHFGLREKSLFVDFNEDAALKADIVSRYNVHRIAVLTGIMTQDECRIQEGLEPRGGVADELLTPANMLIDGELPAGVGSSGPGSDATGVAPDGAGKPSDGVGVNDQPNAAPWKASMEVPERPSQLALI